MDIKLYIDKYDVPLPPKSRQPPSLRESIVAAEGFVRSRGISNEALIRTAARAIVWHSAAAKAGSYMALKPGQLVALARQAQSVLGVN